jgi:plasmid stability protein
MKSFLVRNIPDETMTELKVIAAKKGIPINTLMILLIERLIEEEKQQR